MAERRMFARSVVESARFLKMPVSSQNLYFHLGMNADDDGVVEAYSVLNLVKAHEDDLRVLYSKGFVRILNEDLVTYISDWREQNRLRADRKKDSKYKELLLKLEPEADLLEPKERSDLAKRGGPSMDRPWTAQCSVVEYRLGKDSIGVCSTSPKDTAHILYQLDQEKLTSTDYNALTGKYSRALVDGIIRRILDKPYHGCLNKAKISAWCEEQVQNASETALTTSRSQHTKQLARLAAERTEV